MKYFFVLFFILASSLHAQGVDFQKQADTVNSEQEIISVPFIQHHIFLELAGLSIDASMNYEMMMNNGLCFRIGHNIGLTELLLRPYISSAFISRFPISVHYIFPIPSIISGEIGIGTLPGITWNGSPDLSFRPSIKLLFPVAFIAGIRIQPNASKWIFRLNSMVMPTTYFTNDATLWFGISAGIKL